VTVIAFRTFLTILEKAGGRDSPCYVNKLGRANAVEATRVITIWRVPGGRADDIGAD